MSHTPGPWALEDDHVIAPDGYSICRVAPRGDEIPNHEGRANARLMAAAPDLLQELRNANAALMLARAYIPDAATAPIDEQIRLNRAAIAKAEGK